MSQHEVGDLVSQGKALRVPRRARRYLDRRAGEQSVVVEVVDLHLETEVDGDRLEIVGRAGNVAVTVQLAGGLTREFVLGRVRDTTCLAARHQGVVADRAWVINRRGGVVTL